MLSFKAKKPKYESADNINDPRDTPAMVWDLATTLTMASDYRRGIDIAYRDRTDQLGGQVATLHNDQAKALERVSR